MFVGVLQWFGYWSNYHCEMWHGLHRQDCIWCLLTVPRYARFCLWLDVIRQPSSCEQCTNIKCFYIK